MKEEAASCAIGIMKNSGFVITVVKLEGLGYFAVCRGKKGKNLQLLGPFE